MAGSSLVVEVLQQCSVPIRYPAWLGFRARAESGAFVHSCRLVLPQRRTVARNGSRPRLGQRRENCYCARTGDLPLEDFWKDVPRRHPNISAHRVSCQMSSKQTWEAVLRCPVRSVRTGFG